MVLPKKSVSSGGVGVGGFRYHDLLAVGFGNLREHGGEILQRPMPVRVVGGGEYIVIQSEIVQRFRVEAHGVGVLRIREVNGHQCLRENCPDGSGAGLHQIADVPPGGFPAETAVGLIAQLHHAYVHLGVLQLLKAVRGVAVQGIGAFRRFPYRPTLWEPSAYRDRPRNRNSGNRQEASCRTGWLACRWRGRCRCRSFHRRSPGRSRRKDPPTPEPGCS